MAKVMFISSAGGHLAELLKLDSIFNDYDYILVTEKNKITLNLKNKYKVEYLMYGSRYFIFKYLFVCIINFFKTIYLYIKYRPDLIYTTGAHTAVLMCYIAHLFKKKIIYVEVFDRIYRPTLTGKLLYKIADTFIVQHKELKEVYPKSKYIGGLY